MNPMFLHEVETHPPTGVMAERIEQMRAHGAPIPQIWHLFGFKPEATKHLAAFTHEVMRGPSPLSPGMRELIAAFTSGRNQCPF